MTSVLISRGHRETHGGHMGRLPRDNRGRAECHSHKPRDAWAPRGWRRQEGPSPRAFGGSPALLTLHCRLAASRTVREDIVVL